MRELLEYIVKSLVTKPDEVLVSEDNQGGNLNLNLKVSPEDMGMIIGKAGQTIKAIRRIITARAIAENPDMRVFINLEDQGKASE